MDEGNLLLLRGLGEQAENGLKRPLFLALKDEITSAIGYYFFKKPLEFSESAVGCYPA